MALRSSKPREAVKHALIWFVLFFAFLPFYLMFVISVKNNPQYQMNPMLPDWPTHWHLENWAKAWTIISTYAANSIIVSAAAVAMCLLMALLTSYVLARYRFVGREFVYYAIIATMFLPGTAATFLTLFTVIKDLHMMNTLATLMVCGAVGGQVVSIFILRQFIEDIPKELFESAEIDGAGHLQQIWHIVVPQSGSVLATLAIMQFISVWNELMLPLIIIRDNHRRTIPPGLMLLDGEYVKMYGELMAGYAMASIPLIILFLFTMRLFVKGLTAGAVKG